MMTYFSFLRELSLYHTLMIVPRYCILLFGMNLYRVVFSGGPTNDRLYKFI